MVAHHHGWRHQGGVELRRAQILQNRFSESRKLAPLLASTKRVHCKAGGTAVSLMGHSLQGRRNVFDVLADLHGQLTPFYSDIGGLSIDPELMEGALPV